MPLLFGIDNLPIEKKPSAFEDEADAANEKCPRTGHFRIRSLER